MERIWLKPERAVPVCLSLTLLLVGVALFRSYGISWDEPFDRLTGMVSAKYVLQIFASGAIGPELQPLPDLHAFPDADYGVGFQLPAYALEKLFGLTASHSIYLFRHLLTYLISATGIMAVYGLAARRHASWRVGLLAAGLLFFSPRFFADSFYNDKDIVFAASMAIAAFTMMVLYRNPNGRNAVLHAVASAYALDIRIMAIILLPLTLALLAARLAEGLSWRRLAPIFIGYVMITAALHVLTFPFLWSDPFGNFATVFADMKQFRHKGDGLYLGQYIDTRHLPWHYLPVWIAITTPPLVLVLFASGTVATLRGLIREKWRLLRDEGLVQDLVMLALAAAPVLAVMALHAIIYNGWRHLYFIYPFMVLVAVNGAVMIWRAVKPRRVLAFCAAGLLAVHFIFLAGWMIAVHPLQNVYFNMLTGKDPMRNFETDYWGLANLQGLQYLLAHDASPDINIAVASMTPMEFSPLMLSDEDAKRIHRVDDTTTADYIWNNYFDVHQPDTRDFSAYGPFYQIVIDGQPVLTVLKKRARP